MRKVFADTFYWAAILNPRDQWRASAKAFEAANPEVLLVTTESVMVEVLNYFSEFSAEMRQTVVDTVRDILVDPDLEYVSNSPTFFLHALDFYEQRPDKGYSLTDCISMLAMREMGLREILTHDSHFEQEGFVILL